jgi:hypothetical protein
MFQSNSNQQNMVNYDNHDGKMLKHFDLRLISMFQFPLYTMMVFDD